MSYITAALALTKVIEKCFKARISEAGVSSPRQHRCLLFGALSTRTGAPGMIPLGTHGVGLPGMIPPQPGLPGMIAPRRGSRGCAAQLCRPGADCRPPARLGAARRSWHKELLPSSARGPARTAGRAGLSGSGTQNPLINSLCFCSASRIQTR